MKQPAHASPLEQSIATALSSDIASSDLAALIAEVEAAAASADEAVTEARTRALDPMVVDPTARNALADAEFARDRLQTALPRLQERYGEVVAAERYADWLPSYEAVAAKQAALAQELADIYPEFEVKIIDLLLSIERVDKEAVRVNYTKPNRSSGYPYNDRRYLGRTEEIVRTGGGLSVMTDLKLPAWSGNSVPAWPPYRPLSLQLMPSMAAAPVPAATPEQVAARNAAQQDEGERVIAYYKDRDRQREEREAQEAREAIAREVAERNRRAGWA